MKRFFFLLFFLGFLAPARAETAVPDAVPEPVVADICQDMDAFDPWEGWNRNIFAFNLFMDDYLIKPLAQGYDFVRPGFMKNPIDNFLGNLNEPLNFLNNLLQGELTRAGDSWARFFVNSTFGLLGIFDVAGYENVEEAPEDFGQTLAVWGVGHGAYFIIPFYKPSTVRDAFGEIVVDGFLLDPWRYVADNNDAMAWYYARMGVEILEARVDNLELFDNLRETAADDESFYALIRSLSCQKRQAEINNGRFEADTSASFEQDLLSDQP
jgi:phospholipid-binding lipoprotein MlaA